MLHLYREKRHLEEDFAFALDIGLLIYDDDADFTRFPKVKCVNPLWEWEK